MCEDEELKYKMPEERRPNIYELEPANFLSSNAKYIAAVTQLSLTLSIDPKYSHTEKSRLY